MPCGDVVCFIGMLAGSRRVLELHHQGRDDANQEKPKRHHVGPHERAEVGMTKDLHYKRS